MTRMTTMNVRLHAKELACAMLCMHPQDEHSALGIDESAGIRVTCMEFKTFDRRNKKQPRNWLENTNVWGNKNGCGSDLQVPQIVTDGLVNHATFPGLGEPSSCDPKNIIQCRHPPVFENPRSCWVSTVSSSWLLLIDASANCELIVN